MGVHALS